MASDYDATSMRIPERSPSRQQPPGTTSTMGPGPNSLEIDRYNANGIRTPDNAHLKGALSNGPLPPPGSPGSRNRSRPPSQAYPPTAQDQLLHSQQQDPDDSSLMSGPPPPRGSADRQRAGNKPARSPSGQARICKKCNQVLTGQFVRALDGTFHLDCFRCRDCGQIVASKFFPVDDENGEGQYPLCETDYFRRLGLLCHKCGSALRGSYITALDRKYHVDHFTCSVCPAIFGASDSYYEHNDQVYCHFHYSTEFAQRCNGCQTAILKQFVEIFRNGQNQHWHPECYMIHKFWNVRLASAEEPIPEPGTGTQYDREVVKAAEDRMEEKVYQIWSVLSAFEESSAACISDMLLHVSNGAHLEGVAVAKRFIFHVEILFQSADRLDRTMTATHGSKNMSYGREAKILCKKIVSFFSLLSKTSETPGGKLGVTQDLLTLVTGLAHYLKLLIRICLQTALRLERESQSPEGIYQFLEDLRNLERQDAEESPLTIMNGNSRLSAKDSDHCAHCHKSVEDECARLGDLRWHIACMKCVKCQRELGRELTEAIYHPVESRIYCHGCVPVPIEGQAPFEHMTKLQQYAFLLKVALARLLDILRTNGALPGRGEDGSGYSSEGHYPPAAHRGAHGIGGGEGRSQSQSRASERRESSYENSLNEVRRLRSTRLDKHLSSSVRRARTSRIMDGTETDEPGSFAHNNMIPEDGTPNGRGAVDKKLSTMDALTLDDLPRIVAAEQAKEKGHFPRPGGSRSTDRGMNSGPGSRAHSSGPDGRSRDNVIRGGNRKYFSELSALEYFSVRHFAVWTMHPMVEKHFTLEELLGFIESRKPTPFWKSLFKNDGRKGVKKKGVFGVPLELIIERDGAESTDGVGPGALRIPAILDDIITAMRKMDLSVEGVFRKNGNIKKLGELCTSIDADGTDSLNLMDQPVVQVAALLKRYLRELPDPLMTYKLYKLWIVAAKLPDEKQRKQCLHLTACLLPKGHRDSLEILFYFLKWAGTFHQIDEESGSKMDVKNLATVIAPNILFPQTQTLALDSEPMHAVEAVEVMINNLEEMCMVPDEFVDLLNDPDARNSDQTPKEILKRFQERQGVPRANMDGTVETYGHGHHEANGSRPPPRRYDTDPAVWQQEASVRTMMDAPNPAYGSNSQPSTPPNHHSIPQAQSEPRAPLAHQLVPPPTREQIVQGSAQQPPAQVQTTVNVQGAYAPPPPIPSILQQPRPPQPNQRENMPPQPTQIITQLPPRGYRHDDVATYSPNSYNVLEQIDVNSTRDSDRSFRNSGNWPARGNGDSSTAGVGVAGNN